jgi:hypothetical protein
MLSSLSQIDGRYQNEISVLMEEEVRRSTTMKVQEALDKAVEGGYHIHGSDGMETYYEGATNDYSAWTRKDNESSFLVPTEETFLDPRFWQALGCALGWNEACDLVITCVHGEEECYSRRGYYWMYQWHCFIQAIADGNTPEAFFAHLLSAQTMDSGTKNQHKARTVHLHRSFLWLIAEETRQHSQHICKEAAVVLEVSKDIVQMTRLARQRRRGA